MGQELGNKCMFNAEEYPLKMSVNRQQTIVSVEPVLLCWVLLWGGVACYKSTIEGLITLH